MDQPDDHSLMIAVRAGDLDRLGDLFERHHRALYGFFVRLTGDRSSSEDLVQIVFHRILKYRHTYRDEGRFSAWIYHLARKVAADHFRKEGRFGDGSAEQAPVDLHPSDASSGAERAEMADDLHLLQTALSSLPPPEREVLVLHRFQHLSHAEIARLVGCTPGTAKVRVHRALLSLRDRFHRLRTGRNAA